MSRAQKEPDLAWSSSFRLCPKKRFVYLTFDQIPSYLIAIQKAITAVHYTVASKLQYDRKTICNELKKLEGSGLPCFMHA